MCSQAIPPPSAHYVVLTPQHDRGQPAIGTRGEPGYFAPERVLDDGRIDNFMLDTWGIGAVVLRMALGQRLWDTLWMPAYVSHVVADPARFREALGKAVERSLGEVRALEHSSQVRWCAAASVEVGLPSL